LKVDLEHLHYWMCAIRESDDPKRTLDAFWKGQMQSKEWLIDNLRPHIKDWVRIEIHGGWVGVLASMLFQSETPIKHILSVDIDPACEPIAMMMNKVEEQVGKFRALTADMCNVPIHGDVIINTSCEHITQDQYDTWLKNITDTPLLVLQSNNYKIPEHVRTADSLEDFKKQSDIDVVWAGELKLQLYTRFMIIGRSKK
jgi:hypothetical protein